MFRFIFESFRKKKLNIRAYCSNHDWHSLNDWWDYYTTPSRHVNYQIDRHPQRWEKFKEFTFNQLNEITFFYGELDILWLDGG